MRRTVKAGMLPLLLVLNVTLGARGSVLEPITGAWTPAANLLEARANSTATLLQDGRVLIAGGDGANGALATAEFFGGDGSISVAPAMTVARSRHFAVALQDGRVLVGGGVSSNGMPLFSAEIFDPVMNTWTPAASGMTEARARAAAGLLPSGLVVVSGGDSGTLPSMTIEVFDPATGTFALAGAMSAPRTKHAMAVLRDGRVMMLGGWNGSSIVQSSDIFDPATGQVSAGPQLLAARMNHTATTSLTGPVVIAGGTDGKNDLASVEIFDPAAGTMAAGTSLATARQGQLAVLLPNNNNILYVGGTAAGVPVANAEMYSPWQATMVSAGANAVARSQAAGTGTGADGVLLVSGGADANGAALAGNELYGYATVKTDASDYAPGTTVTITGTGWKPGETVTLTLVESPLVDTHPVMTEVADANGNFVNTDFSPDIHDLNVRFFLTAVGSASGLQAMNTFTDGNVTSLTGTVRSKATGNPVVPGAIITCIVGCSNVPTATTTSNSSGVYVFNSTTTKLTFDTNGPVSLVFTASAPGFILGALSVPGVNNGDTITGKDFLLTPTATSTSTAVTSSVNPSTYGGSVTLTAIVTPTSGSTAPAGSVQFKIDGVNSGSAVTVSACAPAPDACATLTTAALAAGNHSVEADFTGNGAFTNSVGTLAGGQNVNKKSLTVTGITAASKTYDATTSATLNTSGAALSGVVNGDPIALNSASAVGTFSDKNFGSAKSVNISGLTISGTNSTSYTLSQPATTADISTKSLSVSGLTANKKMYDSTNAASLSGTPALQAAETAGTGTSADGKPYSSDAVSISGSATGAFASSNVGVGTAVAVTGLSLNGGAANNYSLTPPNLAADISAATLTYLADAKSRSYGATDPAFTGTVTGFVGTETLATATSGTLVFATTAVPTSAVGSYPINGSGLSANNGNYNFVQSASNATALTITKAHLTVTADNQQKTYDGKQFSPFTASIAGFANGENASVVTGAAGFTGPATTATNAGNYVITPVVGTLNAANYDFASFANGTLAIAQAHLTVTADNQAKTYDGKQFSVFTASITGFVNGENASVVTGAAGFTGPATSATNAGNYAITPVVGTLNAANYDFTSFANGTLMIAQAHLTVTADNQQKTYDGKPFSPFTAWFTGFVNGENSSLVSGAAGFTGAAATATNAGNYPITPTVGTLNAANYDFTSFANGTLTIAQAHLMVTADNHAKTYDGAPFSPLTATITEFVNGENASVVAGAPTFGGPAVGAVDAGTYGITPSRGSLSATNYDFPAANFTSGTLTINQAPSMTMVSVPGGAAFTFDGAAHPATVSVTGAGGLNKSPAPDYSCGHPPVNVADNGCKASYSYAGDTNHLASNGSITYAIIPAGLTITPDGGKVKILGAVFTAFTGTVSGLKGTDAVTVTYASAGAPAAAAIGSYDITVANYVFTSGTAANYTTTTNTAAKGLSVQYGFAGLFAPYATPAQGSSKINSANPLKWQYTDSNGNVVPSSSATPAVLITGPYACGGADSGSPITANAAGNSGYQYEPGSSTWQFNWKTTGLSAGCYNITIKSNQSGQTNGVFPIQLR